MDSGIVASLIAVGGGGIGGTVQMIRAKRRQKIIDAKEAAVKALEANNHSSVRDEARYDNLQQDLDAERNARRDGEARLNAQLLRLNTIVNVLGQDIRIRDDYIMQLRQHIADGLAPPPPPWPISLTKGVEL